MAGSATFRPHTQVGWPRRLKFSTIASSGNQRPRFLLSLGCAERPSRPFLRCARKARSALAVRKWADPARGIAVGRLDLDHSRAEVGQELRRKWPVGSRREIDDRRVGKCLFGHQSCADTTFPMTPSASSWAYTSSSIVSRPFRIFSLCSPSKGAGSRKEPGVVENWANMPL